jgi:hypothetical protein
VLSSLTINLSFGLRPVRAPVSSERAPLLAMVPSPFSIAALIRSSVFSSNVSAYVLLSINFFTLSILQYSTSLREA